MNAALVLRVLVCAAAAYRVARIVAVDKISLPARKWLYRTAWPTGPEGDRLHPWDWAYNLTSCPYCVGFWLSILAWWLFSLGGFAVTVLAVLAVAGVQAQLTGYDRAANDGA